MMTVLPLLNADFEPGTAKERAESFNDRNFSEIALAEYYYFSGEVKKCSDIAEIYIMSPDLKLRLSACMLYAYSNLTLGNAGASRHALEIIRETIRKEMAAPSSDENLAYCKFTRYLVTVLLHLPMEDFQEMKRYISELPDGLRIYAFYVMAHDLYLKGEYGRALGICDAALVFSEGKYPISMIYLYCMTATCEMSLKNQTEAQKALRTAWKIAEKDGFFEPLIEHHGLLQGLLESCIRKEKPGMYKKIAEAVISFNRGWTAVHNPRAEANVTDILTTMEFSIAMLASRGWSNQEISDHIGISINTVKHYLTDIFGKLHVKKRDELKKFVLR